MNQHTVYTRVLLKLSGEALMGDQSYGIDPERLRMIGREVAYVAAGGTQLAVVVGGGNIFRGVSGAAQGIDRATADYMGMLATVMNAVALQDSLRTLACDSRVLSGIHMQEICETVHQGQGHPALGRRGGWSSSCGHRQSVFQHRYRGRPSRARGGGRGSPHGERRSTTACMTPTRKSTRMRGSSDP